MSVVVLLCAQERDDTRVGRFARALATGSVSAYPGATERVWEIEVKTSHLSRESVNDLIETRLREIDPDWRSHVRIV